MKKPLDSRRVLAALLSALLLAAPFAPVYAADIGEVLPPLSWEPTPEQPVILLHWTDEAGNYVSVPAAYQGMVNDMHAYWLQVTDPFVLENRLGSVTYTVTNQDEGDLFSPDPTVGINFASQLDVPVLITNVTQMCSWILIVSTIPMPEPESELSTEPTEVPVVIEAPPELVTQAPAATSGPSPIMTPEPAEQPKPTEQPAPEANTSFSGYARTTPQKSRMRSSAEINDTNTLVDNIPGGELLYLSAKLEVAGSAHPWYHVTRVTVDNASGYMRADVLQLISDAEAQQALSLLTGAEVSGLASTQAALGETGPAIAQSMAATQGDFSDQIELYDGYVLTLSDALGSTTPLQTMPGNHPDAVTLSDLGMDLLLRVDGQAEIDGMLWYRVYSPFAPEAYQGWVPVNSVRPIDDAMAEPYLQAQVTPSPTGAPPAIETPTPEPAATPTPEPVETPTPSPASTPRVEYPAPTAEGPVDRYGFTNDVGVNVRKDPSQTADSAERLTKDSKVWVSELITNTKGELWYKVTAMRDNGGRGATGYILAGYVSLMNDQEQATYIDDVKPNTPATHAPTPTPTPGPTPTPPPITVPPETPTPSPSPVPPPTPTPTARPQPIEGHYAYTIADNVPVRVNPDINAAPTQDVLTKNAVVYVFTQVYDDEGRPWHLIQYNNKYGYILAATTQFMSGTQERDYIAGMSTPAPTPVYTPQPVTPSTLSSYATIKSNAVNLRASTSTASNRLKSLNAGTLVLILGTSTGSDGYTWYKVDAQGTVGYIRGDFVNHMTISQYNDYMKNVQSQGSGGGGGGNSGGGNVNVTIPATPKYGNGGLADLIAIEEGWSNNIRDGLPDYSTASPDPLETSAPTETPDPFAEPDDLFSTPPPATIEEQNSGGSPVLLLVLGVVLMGGAAGVFGYVQYQNNKRKAAARSAAARAQQAGPQGQRRAVTQPVPRDGNTSTIVGGATGAAGSQYQRRPQQGNQPTTRTQPGAQPRPSGPPPQQNPYARPQQQQPQSGADQSARRRTQNPQNNPQRPRDEDLDV